MVGLAFWSRTWAPAAIACASSRSSANRSASALAAETLLLFGELATTQGQHPALDAEVARLQGELGDLETIEMAISASETGHLVIGTMHTSDASTTLNRLLDVFPPAQQTQIRSSVAESLRGIVCQRLLPGVDGGLVLACEILVSNIAIQNLIKEGKATGLKNTMETGLKEGMCLMDNVVFGLANERKISKETAQMNITNRVLKAKLT